VKIIRIKELMVLGWLFQIFNKLRTVVICQNQVFDFKGIAVIIPENHSHTQQGFGAVSNNRSKFQHW
jgi:hypothetical protein